MTGPIVVVAGGMVPEASVRARLGDPELVIAADSGVDHVRVLGLLPDVVVGDLDSVSADGLAWATSAGATVHRHPVDKDRTDLELALDLAEAAADGRRTQVIVVDAGGGRFDHLIGNLTLLAVPRGELEITAFIGNATVTVIRDRRSIRGRPGELVSLFALGAPATGVTTDGLRWALADATLTPGTSLGISNEFVGTDATVSAHTGTVMAIQPGA